MKICRAVLGTVILTTSPVSTAELGLELHLVIFRRHWYILGS